MVIDESKAISILGKRQFWECVAFFQEMLERQCDYKIIMTRRCFSLYKIFLPILTEKGIRNLGGEIITDKALPFYAEKIKNALKESSDGKVSVLIVDDIIIYGRTINSIIDQIFRSVEEEMPEQQFLDKILVKCIWQNKYNSKIKEKYEEIIFSQAYASKMDWKRASCEFSSLIKSANIANTSYIVSYKSDFSSPLNMGELYKNRIYMTEIPNRELTDLGVVAYVSNVNVPGSVFLADYIISCSLRVYFYKKLDSVVVSPLVILKDMSPEEMEHVCSQFIDEFGLAKYKSFSELLSTHDERFYSVKIRLLDLLFSHVLLCTFLKCQNVKYQSDNFDYNEILSYNFSSSLMGEFAELGLQIYNHDICSEISSYNTICNTAAVSTQLDALQVEQYLFRQAMLDNQAANVKNSCRLPGFSEIEGENIFSVPLISVVIALIDSGKATLKSFYENDKFVSELYAGEQAFRIMNDQFNKYLKYLYELERYSMVYSINSYELYKKFIQYLSEENLIEEENKQALVNYIGILEETTQQISDIYVYDCKCSDPSIEECMNCFIEKEVR